MKPLAVGIAGGSCSGKTTLTQRLFVKLGAEKSVILPQDDYFFGLGDAPPGKGGPNFDHPDAVDFDRMCNQLAQLKSGQRIDRPLYDFSIHLPKRETCRTEPKPIILVDGILILQHEPMRHLLDWKIFVDCGASIRLARRLDRDARERGRTAGSVNRVFADQVAPMHSAFVEPSKKHADLIVDGEEPWTDERVDGVLNTMLESIRQESS